MQLNNHDYVETPDRKKYETQNYFLMEEKKFLMISR